MKSIVAGQSRIAIDAHDFAVAAWAFGDQFDLEAGLEIERAMDQCGEIVQRAVRKRAKRHYRTGKLERQIKVQSIGAGWDHTVRVHSGGHAAHLVAGHVRAHMIKSKQPKTPAMPLYVGGSIVGFSEAVKHKATRGDPYFHVGAMNSRLAINAVLKASAKHLAAHLADLVTLKGRA
jgi:hypothetical protein